MAKPDFKQEPRKTPAMIADESFTPTVECLTLMESCRDDLPMEAEPPMLVFLVCKQPGLYATFLGRLISGSSPKAAALCIGQSYRQICAWFDAGANDLADDLDTYCSRFLLDCQRAYAMAVASAEESVFRKDPDKWLGKGHAKTFYKGQFWVEPSQQQIEAPDDPLDPIAIAAPDEDDLSQEREAAADLDEAIKVLEHHNIIQTPQFIDAAKNQYKIGNKDGKAS